MLGLSGFESLEFCANLTLSDNKEQNQLALAFPAGQAWPGESVFCKALSLKDVLRSSIRCGKEILGDARVG